MSPVLEFLKAPWRVGKAGGIVGEQAVRPPRPLLDYSPEENERSEIEYYGGHLIAESIPVELRPAIAVAPEALEVCLLIVKKGEDCSCVPWRSGEPLVTQAHDDDCTVGLANRVVRRFVEEFHRAVELDQGDQQRLAEAFVVLHAAADRLEGGA